MPTGRRLTAQVSEDAGTVDLDAEVGQGVTPEEENIMMRDRKACLVYDAQGVRS